MRKVVAFPKGMDIQSFMEKEYNDLVMVINSLSRKTTLTDSEVTTLKNAPEVSSVGFFSEKRNVATGANATFTHDLGTTDFLVSIFVKFTALGETFYRQNLNVNILSYDDTTITLNNTYADNVEVFLTLIGV